jgi:hypothetical protein
MSGNTFGAKHYSDGKQIAPMLPAFPELTKCRRCDTIFWLSKAKEVGTYEWGDQDKPEGQQADKARFLQLPDYFAALSIGLAETKEEETYIRRQIWWAYNDRIRMGQTIFVSGEDEVLYTQNCTRLMMLLDPSDSGQKIMLAELKRNLGDFDACLQLLQSLDDKDFDWLKAKLIRACKKKRQWVMALN